LNGGNLGTQGGAQVYQAGVSFHALQGCLSKNLQASCTKDDVYRGERLPRLGGEIQQQGFYFWCQDALYNRRQVRKTAITLLKPVRTSIDWLAFFNRQLQGS